LEARGVEDASGERPQMRAREGSKDGRMMTVIVFVIVSSVE
jgi:hypothetical protein